MKKKKATDSMRHQSSRGHIKAGISPDTATRYLTKGLASLVDALTPNRKVGGANNLSRGKEILAALATKKDQGA